MSASSWRPHSGDPVGRDHVISSHNHNGGNRSSNSSNCGEQNHQRNSKLTTSNKSSQTSRSDPFTSRQWSSTFPQQQRRRTGSKLPPIANHSPPARTATEPRPAINLITVSPFSVRSLRNDPRIVVKSPPTARAFKIRPTPPSEFRFFYERGDFPIAVQHNSRSKRIAWKVEVEKLDFHNYLPLFFDGLSETTYPYNFLARQGIYDMLAVIGGNRLVQVVPQLILPIKKALQTRNPQIICVTLKVIQSLVQADDLIGETLVPYYRQILPVLQLFKNYNKNLGDGIEYDQRKKVNIGDLVNSTLELLETHGGPDAFINIKYMVPTYESCVLN